MKKIKTNVQLPKTIPLTKSEVRAWIEELRSGCYEQAQQRLCVDIDGTYSFCCLGVLPQALEVGEWIYNEKRGWRYKHPEVLRNHEGTLPRVFLSLGIQEFLASQNDYEGRTFTEIAEWIERELLPLAKEDPQ